MANVIGIKYRRYRLRLPAGTQITDLGCVTNFLSCCQSGSGSGGGGTVAVACCSDEVAQTLYVTVELPSGETWTWPIIYDPVNDWWYGAAAYNPAICGGADYPIAVVLQCLSGVWHVHPCFNNGCDAADAANVAANPSCGFSDSEFSVSSCSPFYGTSVGVWDCGTCYSSNAVFTLTITE